MTSNSSPTLAVKALLGALQVDSFDRRQHIRYPIEMEVSYQLRHKIRSVGVGHTVNISNRGVLFKTREVLQTHARIDIVMHWPVPLDCDVPLKLVVHGKVVRSDAEGTAV